ncbi:MAG: hypothetical protein HWD61_03125 [Parachlamydiaceae bacterium]|nr:MAG: hypothetical protein HWD61_03125 [Parachlamydiaceae bacterium]
MKIYELNEKVSQLAETTKEWFLNLEVWQAWLLVVGIVIAFILFFPLMKVTKIAIIINTKSIFNPRTTNF